MGYTKASVEEFVSALSSYQDAIDEATQAAEEYLGGLSDEDDDDTLGLLSQSLEDALDTLSQNGIELGHLLKEGTDK